jgi:hypothetical protein
VLSLCLYPFSSPYGISSTSPTPGQVATILRWRICLTSLSLCSKNGWVHTWEQSIYNSEVRVCYIACQDSRKSVIVNDRCQSHEAPVSGASRATSLLPPVAAANPRCTAAPQPGGRGCCCETRRPGGGDANCVPEQSRQEQEPEQEEYVYAII